MKRKSKLAIIGVKGYPGYGGSARANSQLVERLKDKYDITIYAISSHVNTPSTHTINGVKQIVFSSLRNTKATMIKYYIKSLLHCLFVGKYDLIHCYHNISGFMIPFLRIRFPVLFNVRALEFDQEVKWSSIERFIINFSMKIALMFCSTAATVDKSSIDVLKKHTKKQISYIPNGVEDYRKKHLLESNNKPNYDISFSANRIVYMKGLHLVFDALKRADKDLSLQVVGNMNHIKSYKEELLKMSDGVNCDFKGQINDQKELFIALLNSKVFVFPSYLEGMSNQLLEVAAIGLPIIASDIPQNTSVFDAKEVLFFKSGSSPDLQEKIEYAFLNYDEMKNKAQRAYAKILSNHNWDNISKQYVQLYDLALNIKN